MSNRLIVRFAGIAAGTAMVLGFASNASAQSVADLQALIAQLQAQIAALQGGSVATGSITADLTVGSTGSQVSSLQSGLVSMGYLTMPAGVPMGFFGPLTKAAVQKWQAAKGLPASGFFGPLSRGKWVSTGTTGGTTTGGTVGGGTVATGPACVSTPNAEGTLTINSAPLSTTQVNEGQSQAPILAFTAKAVSSDITLRRLKLDLGTDNRIYTKIYSTVYLKDDAGNVLASQPLNSNTVVKDSGVYYVTIAGFNSVVAKSATRTYTVAADVYPTVDSSVQALTPSTLGTVRLAGTGSDAVRGVDCAGIDVYGGTNSITKAMTVEGSVADQASLALSADASTPLDRQVIASDLDASGNKTQKDKVVMLVFNLKADKDDVTVTDLTASITGDQSSSGTTASTTYLYAGSGTSGTLISSASESGASATFSDINRVIPKGTTQTFTIASDIRAASATQADFVASVVASGVSAQNSQGTNVTATGSATGNDVLVINKGIEVTLNSKSVTTSGVPEGSTSNNLSTSTLSAKFNVTLTARGGDILLGNIASGTPVFGTNNFVLYQNGVASSVSTATSTDFTIPSTCATNGTNTCLLPENSSVTFDVTVNVPGRTSAGAALTAGLYALGLEKVNFNVGSSKTITFMAGQTDWRTASVSFP